MAHHNFVQFIIPLVATIAGVGAAVMALRGQDRYLDEQVLTLRIKKENNTKLYRFTSFVQFGNSHIFSSDRHV